MTKVNLNSETSCRNAYIDYWTNENSNITEVEMSKIIHKYDDATRKSWIDAYAEANGDVNKYEFNDEQLEDIRLESYENTKEDVGEDVNLKASKDRNGADGVGTGLSAGAAATTTLLSGGGLFAKGAGLFAKTMSTKFLTKGGEAAKFSKGGLVGYILSAAACIASFAVGLNAKINKANEEEIKAVNELNGEMEDQQNVIDEQQQNLRDLEDDITKATDKATKDNETANNVIQEKADEHSSYIDTINALQAKQNSGQKLSASEISLLNNAGSITAGTADGVKKAQTKAHESSVENLETFEDFNYDYDIIAADMAVVKGVTDYAAEIDEATEKACTTQSTIQKINSISAYAAAGGMALATATFATELGWVNPVAWVVAALGAALAVMAVLGGVWSDKASKEQAQFAQEAGAEVALRKDTQDQNASLEENLDSGVDNYNVSKTLIQTQEMLDPELGTTTGYSTGQPLNSTPEKDDKCKKPEEEK